jgi:hypothetical protein
MSGTYPSSTSFRSDSSSPVINRACSVVDQLGVEPVDLLLELVDALVQLLLAPLEHRPADREEPLLSQHDLSNVGAVAARQQLGWEPHSAVTVALGPEPCPLGFEIVQHGFNDGELRPGLGFVEADQQGAGLDLVAILHPDLGNDTPVTMLHPLGIALHHDHARGYDGTMNGRHRRPAANAAEHDEESGQAKHLVETQVR